LAKSGGSAQIPTAFDSFHIEAFGWNRKMSVMGMFRQYTFTIRFRANDGSCSVQERMIAATSSLLLHAGSGKSQNI